MRRAATLLPVLAVLALTGPASAAVTQAAASAALGAAQREEAQAARLDNRWIPTEAALKAAHAALAHKNYAAALAAADRAKALAQRSVAQANEQSRLWTAAVIR